MDSKFKSIDSRFKEVEVQFRSVDARFKEVDARFDKVDARFDKVDAGIMQILSTVHRMKALIEEQNSRNKYVLDGYEQIYRRMDRLEKAQRG